MISCQSTVYLVNHGALVEHVGVEEPVSQPDVVWHLLPIGRHPGEHGTDEGVPEPEGGRSKLVEDARVAADVVVVGVALGLDPQVVQVHVVPADDAGKELVEGDVLVHRRHYFSALLVEDLVAPVGVHSLKTTTSVQNNKKIFSKKDILDMVTKVATR